jgi:surfeit locus 1 family protein
MSSRIAFRPPLWASCAAGAGLVLFGALAAWQLQRGQDKAALREQLAHPAAAIPLSAATPAPGPLTFVPVATQGRWLPERTLLQDGQSHDGRPGYHVWTPLRLAAGGLAVVDRGWIPARGEELAALEGDARVAGFWRALPEPGMRLAGTDNCPAHPQFPVLVLYPTAAELACVLGEPVLPGLLLLDPAAPGGFARDWSLPGFPPERHYAYAAQWLALALTVVIVYLVLNLKRPPDNVTRGQA